MGAQPVRAVVVAGQVDQLATNLLRGEREEGAHRSGPHVFQGASQTQQSALENVGGFGPALDGGMSAEQVAGQLFEPPPDVTQEFVEGVALPALPAFDPVGELPRRHTLHYTRPPVVPRVQAWRGVMVVGRPYLGRSVNVGSGTTG